jgi:dethiobiotin synthetase
MRGLTILGAGSEADEILACAAVCRTLRASALRPAAFVPLAVGPAADRLAVLAEAMEQAREDLDVQVLPAAASPLVAARLDGAVLETSTMLERAARAARGDVLVSAMGGGLLAPLTPRYAVRDFARELGAPVLLAAGAGPDVVNQVRLNVEAARSGGLTVTALLLTGWPEAPGRLLLEERAELERLVGLPVHLLPGAARSVAGMERAGAAWPVEAWLEPPAEAAGAPAEEVVLEPYGAWEEREVGDPRSTPRPAIMAALLEIVATEGPMTATRLYALYNRAAGGRKLTSVARSPLSSATYWLAQERRLLLTRESEIPWQGDDLVRLPDTPAVRVRTLGPRTLEEVPLDEVAELVARLRAARGIRDPTQLKRAVLAAYGLLRLTARADEYLGLAVDLAAE